MRKKIELFYNKQFPTELYKENREHKNNDWLNKTRALASEISSTDIVSRNTKNGSHQS